MQEAKVKRIAEKILKQYGEHDKVIIKRLESWKLELRMELCSYDKAFEALSVALTELYPEWILEPYGMGVFYLYITE